jgi:hypothetical protein
MLNKNDNFVLKMKDLNAESGEFYFNTSIPIKNADKYSSYGIKCKLDQVFVQKKL